VPARSPLALEASRTEVDGHLLAAVAHGEGVWLERRPTVATGACLSQLRATRVGGASFACLTLFSSLALPFDFPFRHVVVFLKRLWQFCSSSSIAELEPEQGGTSLLVAEASI
jgi:hypothetical protein